MHLVLASSVLDLHHGEKEREREREKERETYVPNRDFLNHGFFLFRPRDYYKLSVCVTFT